MAFFSRRSEVRAQDGGGGGAVHYEQRATSSVFGSIQSRLGSSLPPTLWMTVGAVGGFLSPLSSFSSPSPSASPSLSSSQSPSPILLPSPPSSAGSDPAVDVGAYMADLTAASSSGYAAQFGVAAGPDRGEAGSGSGIRWAFVNKGVEFLNSHSCGPKKLERTRRNDFMDERRRYLESMSYLLEALPDDLKDHEAEYLEESMPPALVRGRQQQQPRQQQLLQITGGGPSSSSDRHDSPDWRVRRHQQPLKGRQQRRRGHGQGRGRADSSHHPRERERAEPRPNLIHAAALLLLRGMRGSAQCLWPYLVVTVGKVARLEHEHGVLTAAFTYVSNGLGDAMSDFLAEQLRETGGGSQGRSNH